MYRNTPYGLRELVSIARTMLIETLPDAVLVLDAHRRVVDLDPAAKSILRPLGCTTLGAPVAALLGDELPREGGAAGGRHELELGEGAARREYELVASPLGDSAT